MNIKKIVHLADLQIRKSPTRNEEYEKVFENLINSLKSNRPDRIVLVGDIVNEHLDLQGEQLILVSNFLNSLALIAPVRITRGNHDFRKSASKRIDSVEAIVKVLNNPNVVYYNKTGFFNDGNIIWAVWHHGDHQNCPWKSKEGKKLLADKDLNNNSNKVYIDLFHESVNGCKTPLGLEMKSKSLYKISDFKGDYSFFGHIHKMQYLDKIKTKAFCGSLIAQDVTEGDDNFHGYLLWELDTKTVEEVSIYNDWSFKNIRITSYTDFDDLDIEIDNPTKFMKVRFIWGTLPQTRNKDNERKLAEYIKLKYNNLTISNKNEFLENDKIDVNENITIENISDKAIQHEIFREYLEKIGTDKLLIDDIIKLDEEICANITIDGVSNVEWNILKFGCKNFRSYEEFNVDWRDKDGLYQIAGINTGGKTTIFGVLTYVLFGETLETEKRVKFGDKRFVNNRNGANYCEGYLVLEANGEYFGIKRRTDIITNKSGEITSTPTTLNYYALSNPDEEMNEDTAIEKLDEDKRVKTQQKINSIIGNFDDFMRIFTTSDTLNRILSNDMATFIDNLLFDSGLDIFDKKLEELKVYQKKYNEKSRITCNIETTTAESLKLGQEIIILGEDISIYETIKIPEIQDKIKTGRTYVETLTKKLFKIDPEIYVLNVGDVNKTIDINKETIAQYNQRKGILEASINVLKETYDSEKLKLLLEKKDAHKTNEYSQRVVIKAHEQEKMAEEHQIEIINGDIFRHKAKGADYKKQILELKESKTCPTCGQLLTPEHKTHINEKIKSIEDLMFPLASDIKKWETIDKKKHQDKIDAEIKLIAGIKDGIEKSAVEMEEILKEIGTLTNDMNDVNRRKELQNELDQIPIKIQNEELKISILQQKIDNYNNSLTQIEENHKIEKAIALSKEKITNLEYGGQNLNEELLVRKTAVAGKELKIKTNNDLMLVFKEQEYHDSIINLYKKCVHRDGIPKQMLSNYVIPKINSALENILLVAQFKVWLDIDDMKPKLEYNNRIGAIIDCISASGKERTFASIVLKFALNRINVKCKNTLFLLDEVMGKLDDDSTNEFIEILQLIKANMKKVLIIEHKVNIEADYVINVTLGENGISTLVLE